MSKYEIEITGNTGGLQRATDRAIKMLDGVSKAASGGGFDIGGGLNKITQSLQGVGKSASMASGGIGGMVGGLSMAGGVFTAVAAAGYALLKTVGDAANKYNELSAASGMSVEEIQKWESAYKGLGLSAEKLVDLNKDVMDKMGEGLREGSGEMHDALEKYGISMDKFKDLANDPQGGMKALIRSYYELKKAGASDAELTRVLEAMGDGASALKGRLNECKNEQEALNLVNSQAAAISNETAMAYKEFDRNMTKLTSGAMSLGSELAGPLMNILNWLFAYFNRDWSKFPFFILIKNMATWVSELAKSAIDSIKAIGKAIYDYVKQPVLDFFGYIAKGLKKIGYDFDEHFPNLAQKAKEGFNWGKDYMVTSVTMLMDTNQAEHEAWLAEQERKEKERLEQQKKDFDMRNNQKAQEDAKKAAEKRAKEEEALRKKAEEARKKALEQYRALNVAIFGETQATIASQNAQLQANISKLDNVLAQGLITHEKYAEMRQKLIDANSKNFKSFLLGAEPEVFFQTLTTLKEAYAQDLAALKSQLEQKLITIEQYNQRKKDIEESFKQKEDLYAQVAGDKMQQMNSDTVSPDNPYAQAALEQINLKQELNAKLEELDNMRDLTEKQREERRLALLKYYRQREADIEQRTADLKLQSTESMFGEMAKTASGFFGKNNKLAKAAFLAEKGIAIGRATMNAQVAASKAMAELPFPMNYVESGLAYAKVAGMVASLKQTEVSGMAHDGIDNIPREGTWLLDRGERVVDQRTNGDLKDFLKSQKSGESSQPIQVHAPLTIQGSVSSDDKRVMEAIKRHPAMVAAAVQDAQRRRM